MAVLLVMVIAILTGVADYRFFGKEKTVKAFAGCMARHILLVNQISFAVLKYVFKYEHFLTTEDYSLKSYFLLAAIAVIVGVLLAVLHRFFREHNGYKPENRKSLIIAKTVKILSFIIVIAGCIIFYATKFVMHEWSSVSLDQLIVNMMSPTTGTEMSIYVYAFEVPIFSASMVISFFGFLVLPFYDFSFRKGNPNEGIRKWLKILFSDKVKRCIALLLSLSMLYIGVLYVDASFDFDEMHSLFFEESDFLEKNYVDPKDANIEFPSQKRNLIYIYLESIENTYLDKEHGGYMDENLMPELTELSYEGIMFSNSELKFGGPLETTGTTWSLASMVNQNLGIPMKPVKSSASYATENHFIVGATGLGDILEEQGYNQTVMVGSNAAFGGLNYLYQTHGGYLIFDYVYAKEHGYIPQDYKVWWGFEDSKLYAFAKEEITRLYNEGKPFNFTMENANTHMPDGYLPPKAPRPYESPYANAINYSQKEVAEFVKWIQQQPFYENTTVILIGDHHSMDKKFFENINPDYLRTQYYLILNPSKETMNVSDGRYVNRQYANFDLFPTTLAAMGCKIEGDRLGVGTNLFSDKDTLIEEYGIDYINSEFMKKSAFYSETLCEE